MSRSCGWFAANRGVHLASRERDAPDRFTGVSGNGPPAAENNVFLSSNQLGNPFAGITPVSAPTELDSGNSTALGASFSTASVSPTANNLLVMVVVTGQGGTRTHDSCTGFGLTWTKAIEAEEAGSGYVFRLSIWYALGTPSPSPDTVDFTMSGNCRSRAYWLGEFANVEPTVGGAGAWDTTASDQNSGDTTPSTDLVEVAPGALHFNALAIASLAAGSVITPDGDHTQADLQEVAAEDLQLGIYYSAGTTNAYAETACDHSLSVSKGYVSLSAEILPAAAA